MGQLSWDTGVDSYSGAIGAYTSTKSGPIKLLSTDVISSSVNGVASGLYGISNIEDFGVISILSSIMEELKISKANDGIGMSELEKDISNILGEYGVGEVKSLIANECIT